MIGRSTEHDNFHTLVQAINEKLGPSKGIDSVDENELQELMKDYTSDESEWAKYNFSSEYMNYTRNLVDKGNGKSNLLVLVWTPGKGSPIHDHADAHCVMKILRGSLLETRFKEPTTKEKRPMEKIGETTYSENQVTYMADSLGVHRISNPHPTEYAVSLHLYTPPNAAKYGCNTFNEETSTSTRANQCSFYSEYGVKVRNQAT
ncbi:cysteine dioxygenase type I [Clathrospora elynae]|uniref:Cysteine dioxygenase n=1 Tax=Clathrospora elynae TaxID=706981 RepID=A0A6A5SFY0_9PLEO|nr:cysteine dioxygenase type I [Clathrospora elynae]